MAFVNPKSIMRTRAQEKVWLVGQPMPLITGTKLPSNQQALLLFFHYHKTIRKTVRESATIVAREVLTFWEKARIPTTQERNVIPRVENLFTSWKNLYKNVNLRNETQIQKELAFVEELKQLFDIAHANAMEIITIEEDKQFLIAQREGRRGYMAGVDKELRAKEKRKLERMQKSVQRQKKEEERCKEVGIIPSDNSSDDGNDSNSSSDKYIHEVTKKVAKCTTVCARPFHIVTPELASALDRTKVTDRKAAFLIAATAKSLGHDLASLAVSKTTIRKDRMASRSIISSQVKLRFEIEPHVPAVIHWDGKILPDISGRHENVDRLPIYVSVVGKEKLLSVPKLRDGTGKTIANAVKQAIDDWKLADHIKAACCDTTASNTGKHSGACTLLEKLLKRSLLYLPCRHHILEIIIGNVFDMSLGYSSGPDIQLFVRFKKYWSQISV